MAINKLILKLICKTIINNFLILFIQCQYLNKRSILMARICNVISDLQSKMTGKKNGKNKQERNNTKKRKRDSSNFTKSLEDLPDKRHRPEEGAYKVEFINN